MQVFTFREYFPQIREFSPEKKIPCILAQRYTESPSLTSKFPNDTGKYRNNVDDTSILSSDIGGNLQYNRT